MQLTHINPPTGYVAPANQEFVEYPKFIHFSDKRPSIIVNDAEEEALAIAGAAIPDRAPAPSAPAAPIVSLVGENNEEAMLRKIAADKGIHLDGRWKLAKIRKAVEVATR